MATALQMTNDNKQPNLACERTPGFGKWYMYKPERISRKDLLKKYPDASRFRKTDGNIAAIDFGTTFCSLAFTTEGDASSHRAQHLHGFVPKRNYSVLTRSRYG